MGLVGLLLLLNCLIEHDASTAALVVLLLLSPWPVCRVISRRVYDGKPNPDAHRAWIEERFNWEVRHVARTKHPSEDLAKAILPAVRWKWDELQSVRT